ncbi:hypothetical protein ACO2Q0_07825 [Phenylobacterium sp. VNQ135]|uniref:hypothetical protein n=1 Tax=Phenylobacterium sp. VNQ135 TaxID=3400922 RepID=UPI003C00B917
MTAHGSRFSPAPASAAAALLMAVLVLFAPGVLNDPDTYWHLAAGGWILDHRTVPRVDVFSHTMAGAAWVPHEWLAEVLMALAYRAGGFGGVLALFAAAAAAAAALVAQRLSRSLSAVGVTLALVLAAGCLAPSLVARPHLLVLPVLTGWVVLLLAARDADRAPPPWAALLMVLWANLHGSYVLGLSLAGAFGLEALLASRDRLAVIRGWGLFGLACALAAAATPNGLSGLIHPFTITSMSALPTITEWRPADFSKPTPFEVAILSTVFLCLWKGVKVPPLRLLIMLGLLHLALQHLRHQMVLGAVAPLILAPHIGEALGRAPGPAAGLRRAGLMGAALLAAILIAARLAVPVARDDAVTPAAALAHVPAELRAQPVFNDYDFGGYLIFSGVRPFIDGRADMYGDAFTQAYMRADAGDPAMLAELLGTHRIAWTLLRPESAAARRLDADPAWRRLYADERAVVHVRAAP